MEALSESVRPLTTQDKPPDQTERQAKGVGTPKQPNRDKEAKKPPAKMGQGPNYDRVGQQGQNRTGQTATYG